mgnify:FL=1
MFDKDGDGELDRNEIEQMVLMATRVVVRKQYNAGNRKVHNQVATGNTEVDIPEELMIKIKEIINEIFEKVDVDGVWVPYPRRSSSWCLRLTHPSPSFSTLSEPETLSRRISNGLCRTQ